MDNQFTPKQLKLAVTRSIALDPSLSAKIVEAVGFEPVWSKMTNEQLEKVQEAWENLRGEMNGSNHQ
jgi:hypothetical protein